MTERPAAILTPRFLLRPLTAADATRRYQGWLRDTRARRHIQFARRSRSLPALRAYIVTRRRRSDCLFLGIFLRDGGEHIGNIKYEPIDRARRAAELGILIGEPAWRGRGVAPEVIRATARWLNDHRGITKVLLGVEKVNRSAVAAYRRTGFRPFRECARHLAPPGVVRMVLSAR